MYLLVSVVISLFSFQRKERRMAELTMAMEQERDKLEHTKNAVAPAASVMCARCKDTQAAAAGAVAPVNRTLGDGQYSVVSN